MKIKISATFEGKCDFCGKDAVVFSAGNEENHKAITICQECAKKYGDEKLSDMVEEHGRVDDSVFEEGVKIEKKGTAS